MLPLISAAIPHAYVNSWCFLSVPHLSLPSIRQQRGMKYVLIQEVHFGIFLALLSTAVQHLMATNSVTTNELHVCFLSTLSILIADWKPDRVQRMCMKKRSEEKVMQIPIPPITNYVSGAAVCE